MGHPELVEAFRGSRIDADVVHSLLEDGGIASVLQGAGLGNVYPMNVGALGEGRILVRAEDVDAAHALIASALEQGAIQEFDDEDPLEP